MNAVQTADHRRDITEPGSEEGSPPNKKDRRELLFYLLPTTGNSRPIQRVGLELLKGTEMPHGIYPAKWAEMNKPYAGQKYCPSNGTEGACFFDAWCCHCARDKSLREGVDFDECDDNERCDIIGRTMAFNEDDPEYPSEWQYDADGQPCCKAFIPAGEPVRPSAQELEAAGQERLFA